MNLETKNFKSSNNLEFTYNQWELGLILGDIGGANKVKEYHVGTVSGQFTVNDKGKELIVISILNHNEGNGHVLESIEWFEYLCKLNKYDLIFDAIMNEKFRMRLLSLGFKERNKDSVIKIFKDGSK